MPYTANALRLVDGTWSGTDLDLSEVQDLDELVELLRETADGALVSVLFLEEDDEYLAIVRVDEDSDARMFISDRRVLEGPGLAGRLLGEEVALEPAEPGVDDEESGRPEVAPGGEAALLDDLGVTDDRLLRLCSEEGLLPADVIFSLCENLGASEVLEAVRGV